MDPGFLKHAELLLQSSHTSEITGKAPGELARDSNSQPRTPPKILRSCMCNTTTPGRPRRADLPECCISRDAVDKMTSRALALHREKWTSEPGKTDSVPISEELVVQVPQKASRQSNHPIPAASAPLRAGASLASGNTPQVQEEGRLLTRLY